MSSMPARSMLARLPALLAAAAFAFLLAGCAVGNKYNYRDILAQPQIRGSGRLAVAVHDQRPDVVSGEEDRDWVGVQRGGFGNPFDVATESGNALADDWAHAVATTLTSRGFAVAVVPTAPADPPAAVIGRLRATGAQALLLFVLRQWHSDTMMNVTLHHDVALDVLSPAGAVLGHARVNGASELGGDFVDPPSHAREVVPKEFTTKLEVLLNHPHVVRAIQQATGAVLAPPPALPAPPPPPPAPPPPPPT